MKALADFTCRGKLILKNDNDTFPTSPTVGQFALVGGVLYIWTEVEGVQAWRPLTRENQHYKHVQTAVTSTWSIVHGLNSQDLIVVVYDEEGDINFPSTITFSNNDSIILNFSEPTSGKALIFAMSDSAGFLNQRFTQYTETVFNNNTKTSSFTVDITKGVVQLVTIGGACTISFSGFPSASQGQSASVVLSMANGGAYTVTWSPNVKWGGGTKPTLTTAGIDRLVFVSDDGGQNIYGFAAGLDLK
jgi:hypothetical protein